MLEVDLVPNVVGRDGSLIALLSSLRVVYTPWSSASGWLFNEEHVRGLLVEELNGVRSRLIEREINYG